MRRRWRALTPSRPASRARPACGPTGPASYPRPLPAAPGDARKASSSACAAWRESVREASIADHRQGASGAARDGISGAAGNVAASACAAAGVVAAVLAARRAHAADRPAVDAGRGDADVEPAVGARVAGEQRQRRPRPRRSPGKSPRTGPCCRLSAAPARRLTVAGSRPSAPLRLPRATRRARRAFLQSRHFRTRTRPCRSIPPIFKAYDIRGVVGKTIDEAFAEHLGRAFGSEAVAAGEKAVAVGRDGRVSGPALVGRADARAGLDRARRGRHRRGDDADAVLRGRHARRAWLQQRHPGHRQPQPEGLQRLQDGAGRPRHLRRRHPGAAQRIEAEDYIDAAAAARAGWTSLRRIPRPHRQRLQAGAADEDRRRLGQRHPRRVGARHPARAGLRGDRPLQPRSTATFPTTIPIRASPRTWPT